MSHSLLVRRLVAPVLAAAVVAGVMLVAPPGGAAVAGRSTWPEAVPLAAVVHGELVIYRAGVEHRVGSGSTIGQLSWSPDGSWLLFTRVTSSGATTAWVVDAGGGGQREVDPADDDVTWESTGHLLVAGAEDTFSSETALSTLTVTGIRHRLATIPGSITSIAAGGGQLEVASAAYRPRAGFTAGYLSLVSDAGATRTALRSSTDAYDADGFSPDGKSVLYDLDPQSSASLASDGVEYRLLRPGGKSVSIGTGLAEVSWRSWSPDSATLAITLGDVRAAWATNKHLVRCTTAGACTPLAHAAGSITFEPAISRSGHLVYVTAEGLGGTDGGGSGAPLGTTTDQLQRWVDSFRVTLATPSGPKAQTSLGAAFGPAWVGGGGDLLYVHDLGLWLLAAGSTRPVAVTGPFLALDDQNWGLFSWSPYFALAPRAP